MDGRIVNITIILFACGESIIMANSGLLIKRINHACMFYLTQVHREIPGNPVFESLKTADWLFWD